MANPQSEAGHTRISNELLEAILKHDFTGQELKTIFFIARETYGWSRTKAQISYGMISRATGMCRRNLIRICRSLNTRRVIFFQGSGNRYAHIIGLQKNYELWDKAPVDNLVTPRPLPSDAQTTRGGDAQTTSQTQASGLQTTSPSGLQTTPSKQKAIRLKQAENKQEIDRPEKIAALKAKLSALIKGHEHCITNCDPRPVIDALVAAGYDVMRVWGALVQARDKKNPPGYLVTTLCSGRYAVADSALLKAKAEAEKWQYFAGARSLVSQVANQLTAGV